MSPKGLVAEMDETAPALPNFASSKVLSRAKVDEKGKGLRKSVFVHQKLTFLRFTNSLALGDYSGHMIFKTLKPADIIRNRPFMQEQSMRRNP